MMKKLFEVGAAYGIHPMAADQWVQWESFASPVFERALDYCDKYFLLIEQVLSSVWEYLLFFIDYGPLNEHLTFKLRVF